MTNGMARSLRFGRSTGWTIVATAAVVGFAWSVSRRAINLTDEGYLLSQVVDMLGGKVLYRDMDAFVTPGIWFLLAGLFEVVEPSVIASRSLAFSGYLAMLFVSYRIVTNLAGRAWAWSTVFLLMVATIWAFPAWTTAFYSPFAVLFALAALERQLSWRRHPRRLDLFLCGLFLGLSILFKQNYGVFASVGMVLGFLAFALEDGMSAVEAFKESTWKALRLAAGIAIVALPVVAYLTLQGALPAAFELLVLHPFDFMSRQDIPYPSLSMLWAPNPLVGIDALTYGAYSLSQAPNPFFTTHPALGWTHGLRILERANLLLFWLPIAGLVAGLVVAVRPRRAERRIDGDLLAVLAVATCVFFGVFPRADFNHLINVYQPIVVAGVLVAHRIHDRSEPSRRSIPTRIATSIFGMMIVFYVGIAAFWYVHQIRAMDSPVGTPRGGVLVTSMTQQMIEFHVDAIRARTRDGDAVLTIPALAMFNFLTERPVPGRYYNLYEHHIAHDGGAGVVDAAEALHVDLVVSDYNNFFSDRVGLREYAPELADYLRTRFEPEFDVAGHRFRYLVRREVPVLADPGFDLVDHCDLDPEATSYAREHLLFASLYQIRNARRPRAPIDTPCVLEIPENARLDFAIDYPRPEAATPRARLKAEIWLVEDENREKLFSEVIPIEPEDGWTSPPPPRYRVDLSRFGGRKITLLLRASFFGRVRMPFLKQGGFSLIWQDPRITTPRRASPSGTSAEVGSGQSTRSTDPPRNRIAGNSMNR